jgi:histidinol dehydrogenase
MMNLQRHKWASLTTDEQAALLERPAVEFDASIRSSVKEILGAVKKRGDAALQEYTQKFDGIELTSFEVTDAEYQQAEATLTTAQITAIDVAIANVRRFHEQQMTAPIDIETMPGVRCQRISHPIDSIGLYVPAGSAPLPSTALMLAVPAAIANCPERILCTPCQSDGLADAGVVVAARRAGISRIFKLGGAQAIAAMAYGTESIPRVEKIFGPGNAWVTAAKTEVASEPGCAAIDMPAGPSEVLVIADDLANADFVASDLLSQAEHGADSQVILICLSDNAALAIADAITRQLPALSRRTTVAESLEYCRFLVARTLAEAVDISNRYAPEHLIIHTSNPRDLLPSIRNAGSVFLGPWSPESVGDYCSGTNHVLPTYGSATAYSGLGVDQFMRQMTVQELTRDGLVGLAQTVVELATMEGLDAHANAVRYRIDSEMDQL